MILENNFAEPDTFYDELTAMHGELNEEESAALNSRLVLILANQIGDMDTLRACMKVAQNTIHS